ncbi:hypothetical protein EYC84_011965 [Monilinia fructicola]|uniref:Uncharacterized protein n=1 Tax=Monilinia fructicola TaxID=38448 RepID=A0A5M9J804_MONFR|nr:hypothetical protein EYC84_011965 [Monilinia fructicola]
MLLFKLYTLCFIHYTSNDSEKPYLLIPYKLSRTLRYCKASPPLPPSTHNRNPSIIDCITKYHFIHHPPDSSTSPLHYSLDSLQKIMLEI